MLIASTVAASELQTLTPPDGVGASDDAFGYGIAAAGSRVAIASPGEDDARGEVYAFDCTAAQCTLDAHIELPILDSDSRFGTALAMDGDRLAVSAPNSGIGEVFVLERGPTGWTEQPVPGQVFGSGGRFGIALALSGDTLIVGADDQDGRRGVAYVWRLVGSNWEPEQTLRPGDRGIGDRFGSAVAISGDTALVASPYAQAGGVAPDYAFGEVGVFTRVGSTWTRTQVLRATLPATAARFGFSVALEGDTAVIGAPGNDLARGRVHVFQRSAGVFSAQADWVAPDIMPGDAFGWSLAMRDDRLLVAAPFAGVAMDACGRVESYRRELGNFVAVGPLRTGSATPNGLFGWSLALGANGEFASTPAPVARAGLGHYFSAAESVFDDAFENVLGPCFETAPLR